MKTIQTLTPLKKACRFLKQASIVFSMLLAVFYSKSTDAQDAGVLSIIAPTSSCSGFSSAANITVRVVNYGSTVLDSIPMAYKIDTGTAVHDTVTASLGAGDSVNFTFAMPANLSADSVYTIKAYTALLNDTNHANDTATIVINLNLLRAGFTSVGSCQGTAVNFTNTSSIDSGSLFYAWNFGDGLGASTATNPTYTYSKPGTYVVSLVVNSTPGCKDSVTHIIKVSTSPVAAFTALATCIGSPTTFSDSSKVANDTIVSTVWSFGDGDSSTALNPMHIYSTTGTYQAVLTVTTDSGCSATATDSVTISPLPVASFSVPAVICSGTAVTFADSSKGNGLSYNWSFGDSTTSTLAGPAHTFNKSGKYQVQLTVTSLAGCQAVMSDSITVNPSPVAAFSVANVCFGDSARFVDMSTISDGSTLTYNWNFGDTTTASYRNPAHLYMHISTYSATEAVTSNAGCSDSITQPVTVNPLPIGGFTTTLDNTLTVGFMAIDTAVGLNYAWDFGDGTGIDTGFNPSHTFEAQGIYDVTMTVKNGNGCSVGTSDSVDVVSTGIKEALQDAHGLDIYPNPFSDVAYINYNLGNAGLVNLSVYSETGKLMTTIIDGPQGPGNYQYTFNASNDAPTGLYLVKFSVDGNSTMKKIMEIK